MSADSPKKLELTVLHRARRLAYWNGLLWAIGNGLSSSTLVIYLAMELHAQRVGMSIGLILAARHFLGVLRLGAPAVIERWMDRKTFCLITFAISGVLLLSLPPTATPGVFSSAEASLAALVILWCLHHLMQYLGTIALYSWLADLVPLRIRGRFFGHRERWLVAGEAAAAIACGLFAEAWQATHPKALSWVGYAIPAGLGALFMLAAIVPVWLMPRLENTVAESRRIPWETLGKPLGDRAFLALLLFGCWFSFSNGLTQTLQFSYPKYVLHVGIFLMLAVQTGMRLGQIGISPALGRMADRFGNKPLMLVCLAITAQGPLFFFLATPADWWWFLGAWIAWIGYAGLNIGLPNLMLKIAPRAENAGYLAVYYTLTGLCYGFCTLLNGWLYDACGKSTWTWLGRTWDFNQALFFAGWIARGLGILFLIWVIEPAALQPHRTNS